MRPNQPPPTKVAVPLRFGHTKTQLKPSIKTSVSYGVTCGLANANPLRVCGVCQENESKYTCPRCNVVYCGVECYKRHGTTCTEQFYKDHVQSEMKLNKSSDTVKETKEMLQRVHEAFPEHSPMDERIDDLVELMENDALTLDDLTDEERTNFLREVADGRLGKYINLWEPWWKQPISNYQSMTKSQRHQLIQVIDDEDDDVIDLTKDSNDEDELIHPVGLFTPTLSSSLPELHALNQNPNHQVLMCNLVEVLFSYAYVMRVYNGDWRVDALEAGSLCLAYSSVLQGALNFESVEQVVHRCQSNTVIADSNTAAKNAALCDVVLIVTEHLFVMDALSDLLLLIQSMKKEEKSKTGRKQLTRVIKKIEFYISWAKDATAMPIISSLHPSLVQYVT